MANPPRVEAILYHRSQTTIAIMAKVKRMVASQDLYFSGFSAFPQKEFLFQEQVKDSLTQPVFSPMKQELIDRIMKEFWVMFNQESEAIQ
jgi:hypothetical protein